MSVSSIGCMNLHPIEKMGKGMQDEGRVVIKKKNKMVFVKLTNEAVGGK